MRERKAESPQEKLGNTSVEWHPVALSDGERVGRSKNTGRMREQDEPLRRTKPELPAPDDKAGHDGDGCDMPPFALNRHFDRHFLVPEHARWATLHPSAAWLKFRAGTLTYPGMLEGDAITQEELP